MTAVASEKSSTGRCGIPLDRQCAASWPFARTSCDRAAMQKSDLPSPTTTSSCPPSAPKAMAALAVPQRCRAITPREWKAEPPPVAAEPLQPVCKEGQLQPGRAQHVAHDAVHAIRQNDNLQLPAPAQFDEGRKVPIDHAGMKQPVQGLGRRPQEVHLPGHAILRRTSALLPFPLDLAPGRIAEAVEYGVGRVGRRDRPVEVDIYGSEHSLPSGANNKSGAAEGADQKSTTADMVRRGGSGKASDSSRGYDVELKSRVKRVSRNCLLSLAAERRRGAACALAMLLQAYPPPAPCAGMQ